MLGCIHESPKGGQGGKQITPYCLYKFETEEIHCSKLTHSGLTNMSVAQPGAESRFPTFLA